MRLEYYALLKKGFILPSKGVDLEKFTAVLCTDAYATVNYGIKVP